MRPSVNYSRCNTNHIHTDYKQMHNVAATLVYHSVMQHTCSWSCRTNYHVLLCHKVMFNQFKRSPNIAATVTGQQSGWLRNHRPVSTRNRENLPENVL